MPKTLPDFNLFYNVEPDKRGLMIDHSNGGLPKLKVSQNGLSQRTISNDGVVDNYFNDPNYFSNDIWIPAPVVSGLKSYPEVGEELTLTVTNLNDHITLALPGEEMVYHWRSISAEPVELTGAIVRITVEDGLTPWEVYGESPSFGRTPTLSFDVLGDEANVRYPRVQTITGFPNTTVNYLILNFYDYDAPTFNWYDEGSSTILETTTIDNKEITFPSDYGVTTLEVEAIEGGVSSGRIKVPVITSPSPNSMTAFYFTSFIPADAEGRSNLSDYTDFGWYGTRGYFKVQMSSGSLSESEDTVEIELYAMQNAILLNPGIFRHGDIVELEFNSTAENYGLGFKYVYREKGTVGGIHKTYGYTFTNVNQTPYDFDINLPDRVQTNSSGSFMVDTSRVLEQGKYTFSVDQTTIDRLGLSASIYTKFDTDTPIGYVASGTNNSFTGTITVYNILSQAIHTFTFDLEMYGYTPTAYTIGVGTTNGSGSQVLIKLPYRLPIQTESLDFDNMIAYDIFNINSPKRLTDRLLNYGFPSTSNFPYELYREDDITVFLTEDDQSEEALTSLRRFNLDLHPNGQDLTNASVLVNSNGNDNYVQNQIVVNPNGFYLPNNGLVLFDGVTNHATGTPWDTLSPYITAAINGGDATTWRAYIAGPSQELLLIIPQKTYDYFPCGLTVIDIDDENVGGYHIYDPVNNQTDSGATIILDVPAGSGVTLQALSTGATVTAT